MHEDGFLCYAWHIAIHRLMFGNEILHNQGGRLNQSWFIILKAIHSTTNSKRVKHEGI